MQDSRPPPEAPHLSPAPPHRLWAAQTVAPGRPAAPQLSMPLHSTKAVVEMMRRQASISTRKRARGPACGTLQPLAPCPFRLHLSPALRPTPP